MRIAILLLGSAALCSAEIRKVPLVEAAKSGDVSQLETLLATHADPNSTTPDGATALMAAARENRLDAVRALLKAGADPKLKNRYGVTALYLACNNGNAPVVTELLRAGADANGASDQGETVLMTAARSGSLEAVQALIKGGANVSTVEKWKGQTALMWAAAEGHTEVVKALLASGADPHARAKPPAPPKTPGAPTDGAARRRGNASDFTPMLFAVREGFIETVKTFLDAGEDPNEALSDGQSALHIAAANANYDIGVLLMDRGAKSNADACGWTPLHQVAWTRRPNIHKTPAALGNGKLDSLGFTKALLAHGADINARETKDPSDGNLGKLRRPGATAFILAAKSSDPEYMRFLGSLGADARLMTNEEVTALETAAGIGIYRVGESPGANEEALDAVKVAYDLAHGDAAYVNHIDKNGRTALHGAAMRGSPEIVQFLYDHGANATIDRKDFLGWSALTIAEGVMWPTVLKTELPTAALLVKLGAKHEEVPDEIRNLGMATQGVDNGLDRTMGGGPPSDTKSAFSAQPNVFPTSLGDVTFVPIEHASVLIQAGGNNIYIDPSQGSYEGRPPADLILFTDIHGDHLSPAIIEKLKASGTRVWGPKAAGEKIHLDTVLANGDSKQWGDWTVEAVPAYNRVRGEIAGQVYHEKGRGNGYVLTFGGKRFYFSGDTESIPEMDNLHDITAAFICMNLPYTMTPEEATLAVQRFHPKVVYPYHYRNSNLNSFAAYMKGTGIEVRLRDWYPAAAK